MKKILQPLCDKTPREMIDAEGYKRQVVTYLMAYIANLEEQWMLVCLGHNSCPSCNATYHDLDSPTPCLDCTSRQILTTLKKIRQDYPDATPF